MAPKQIIVVRKDLNMRKGKLAAQVAHASMGFLLDRCITDQRTNPPTFSELELDWALGLHTKIVVGVNSEAELLDVITRGKAAGLYVYSVYDAGLTEFHGQTTLTCAAFGPALHEDLHPITGALPLL